MQLTKTTTDQFGRQVKRPARGAYVLASGALLIVLFFMFCFRTVGAGQVGIVTRFGEVDRTAESGVVIKLPWPIERLHKMDTRIQKEEQNAAAATSDLQDVNATLALNYSLNRDTALEVYKNIGTDYKDRVIVPALQESFKSATAKYTAGELLIKRGEVKGQAYEMIKNRLKPYGVTVTDLNIVNFSFSPEFSKAIEAKQVAAQEAEKSKYLVEQAKNQAQADIETAKGKGQATLENAAKTAEANRLLSETATPQALQKQAIDKWDGKLPTYWGGGSAIFNIPLQGQ